jgi:hypothetical protein
MHKQNVATQLNASSYFSITALQSLKSPLMPTLAESGREESDHDNVISLTYSVPAGLMRSLQETHQVSYF